MRHMPPVANESASAKTRPATEPTAATDPAAPPEADRPEASEPVSERRHGDPKPKRKRTLWERAEAFVSRLSTKNHFWHSVCSRIWLPYAFKSGIKMKMIDSPPPAISRNVLNRRSASGRASTAVGSSRMRMRASR